jgi:hypothetical protein
MVQLPKRENSIAEYQLPDEGTYTLVLDRLSEERPSRFEDKDGNYPPEQEFYFKIINDEEYEGVELRDFVRTNTFYDGSGAGQPAKVYLIARALLGPNFDPDIPPDTEDLVGLKCTATIVHKKKAQPDGTTRTFANLTGYAPLRRKRQVVEPVEDDLDIPF